MNFRIISALTIFMLLSSGCAVLRATGDTVEAMGTGVSKVIGGFASGTESFVGGTGRAVSRAAGGRTNTVRGAARETEQEFAF